MPGVSRSGATITAGLFLGFDRESAARYSFLLSVPAVVLSGLFELRKIGDEEGAGAGPTLIATLLAFVVGYASIAFLLRWLAQPLHGDLRGLPRRARRARARAHGGGRDRLSAGSEQRGGLAQVARAEALLERA